MKCDLNPEIEHISGKCGALLYKTYNRPNGKKETRVYLLPRKKGGGFGYTRTKPLSQKECEARKRFAVFSDIFSKMTEQEKNQYAVEMNANNYMFNGKKYATLRGYIMARLYAEQGC